MALVLVTGIEIYDKDPLVSLYENIKENSLTEKDNILLEGFLNLVINICKIYIASLISQFFPFAVTKNSKYVQGIETVYV